MEVRIVDFPFFGIRGAETTLNRLVNQGWRIVAAGGAGGVPFGFVVLQRDEPKLVERAPESTDSTHKL